MLSPEILKCSLGVLKLINKKKNFRREEFEKIFISVQKKNMTGIVENNNRNVLLTTDLKAIKTG